MGPKNGALRYTFIFWCLLFSLLLLAQLSEGKKNPSRSRSNSRNNNNNNDNDNNNNNNNRANKQRSPRKARSSRCKDKTTFSLKASDLGRKPFTLKCPKGPITDTEVVGIKGHCRGTSRFIRWAASRCQWNDTCSISFKGKPMDQMEAGVSDHRCTGEVPDKLQIGYTCLKKKVVITDVLGTFKKTRKRAGIVRSHKLFPWSYRNGDELGNVTFIRPRKPVGLSTLWITVHSYAILNSDIIFLSWEDKASNSRHSVSAMRQITFNDTTFSVPNVDAITLTFFADYRNHYTSIGGEEKGFLLCYQWLKPKGKPKKGSACSKVMAPAKCRNKKGSRKGRKSSAAGSRGGKRARDGNSASNSGRPRNNKRPRKTPRNSRPSRQRQQQ